MKFMKSSKWVVLPILLCAGVPVCAQTKSTVIEEIVARVNNEIITREDLENARKSLVREIQDACTNCSSQQVREQIDAKDKDLLRDLIDQSLLVQRAKD